MFQTKVLRWSRCLSAVMLTSSVALMAGAGCPATPPPDINTAPVANAGANQTVAPGDAVTLNGSASADPDGDTLTFAWTQTAGTAVALTGANTATATFTAPAAAGTLTFQLTVSDGALTATDTVDVGVNVAVQQTPILYVANFNGSNITAYDISSPNNVNGNVPPGANLAGGATLLSGPTDIVVDTNGALLVSNQTAVSVTGYPNASDLTGVNGNIAPTRNVQGAATTLVLPLSLAIQETNDLLFVADNIANAIRVYASASTANFNGNLAPLRVITSANLGNPFGINFGANDTLYVANKNLNNIAVFANASTLNGAVAASRVITSAVFNANSLNDVFVDTADRMYVVDSVDDQIHVFNNASTLNGNANPAVTLTVTGAGTMFAVAVDSQGRGYLTDFTLNAVYSYDNIATRNGALAPDRTLTGATTQLSGPVRVFLLE